MAILGNPTFTPDIPNQAVAAEAGTTLKALSVLGDENAAMTQMAQVAVAVTLEQYRAGKVNGIRALGETMGTVLALDVTAALPLGMPKFIVTTVAFSHLIPPQSLAPDLMMILRACCTG